MPKPTLGQYAEWAKQHIGFDPTDVQFTRRYTANTAGLRTSVEQSDAWNKVSATFSELSKRYRTENGVFLFTDDAWEPALLIKPVTSVIEKMYRVNVVRNNQFPDAPADGWLVEDNLFARMDDLVRCRVVCRYMDGPQYICGNTQELLGDEIVYRVHSMETELGYYAWHLGIKVPAAIMRANGTIDDEVIRLEVQLTTHLNDVLNDLTHSFYENRRIVSGPEDALWKWQPNSDQFKGAYFGHTLHLLEGMIVELKNEIARKAAEKA